MQETLPSFPLKRTFYDKVLFFFIFRHILADYEAQTQFFGGGKALFLFKYGFSRKEPFMDVSDFRYLQIIYSILADHEFERISFSNFQFRQLIINGFRNLNISIHIYDESNRLYTIERTILIFSLRIIKKIEKALLF